MNNTYIKLFIGVVLFATLVALTVLHVPGDERLLDLIYGALVGMGIMHIGSQPPGAGAPPTDKQAGQVSLPMLLVVTVFGAVLTACATGGQQSTTQSTQVGYTQACAGYGAAFATALELRRAGKLNRAQIDQVTLLDSQITPICTGPLPADPAVATRQVAAAVTALAILEAVKKEN